MDKPEGYDDAVDDKRSAVKVILLGDSAVGKTKSAPVAPDFVLPSLSHMANRPESRLVERFLMDGYQPQQMSTYVLTALSELRDALCGHAIADYTQIRPDAI